MLKTSRSLCGFASLFALSLCSLTQAEASSCQSRYMNEAYLLKNHHPENAQSFEQIGQLLEAANAQFLDLMSTSDYQLQKNTNQSLQAILARAISGEEIRGNDWQLLLKELPYSSLNLRFKTLGWGKEQLDRIAATLNQLARSYQKGKSNLFAAESQKRELDRETADLGSIIKGLIISEPSQNAVNGVDEVTNQISRVDLSLASFVSNPFVTDTTDSVPYDFIFFLHYLDSRGLICDEGMKLNDLKVLNLLFSDLGFIKEVNDRGYTVFLKKIDQVLNGVSYRKTPENTLPPIGEQIRLLVNPGDAHKDFGTELKKAFTEKWNRNTPDHQRLTLQDIHKFYGVGKSVSIGCAEHGKHSGYVSATIHRIVDLENSTLVFVEHKHYIPIFEFGLDGKLKVVQEYNQSWLAP